MKMLKAGKIFAMNAKVLGESIPFLKDALLKFKDTMSSLIDSCKYIGEIIKDKGRIMEEGKKCHEAECDSMKSCYEELYGELPPAMTRDERMWKNKYDKNNGNCKNC